MNKNEATDIILEQLKKFRSKSYEALLRMIECEPITYKILSSKGIKYQIEIQALWDDKANENIRVIGSIDDGGIRSIFPLSKDFLKSPNNDFVGE